MELIDKKKLAAHLVKESLKLENAANYDGVKVIEKLLWYLVDVESIDAVPVVRCKDCVHGININDMIACTEFREVIHKPEDFCSYGERKEGAD